MWTHEHTLETDASAEAIWRLWADVSTWSSWDDDIDWATLKGPFAVGSRVKLKPRGIPAHDFTLVSIVPGVSFATEQRLPLLTLRFDHELTATPGHSTRFTHRVTIIRPLAPLFAFVFGRRMKAGFGKIMRHLAQDALASGAISPDEAHSSASA